MNRTVRLSYDVEFLQEGADDYEGNLDLKRTISTVHPIDQPDDADAIFALISHLLRVCRVCYGHSTNYRDCVLSILNGANPAFENEVE